MAPLRIDRLEVFFSSCTLGSCFFSWSKHTRNWARLFFSSLLCTSLVPARIRVGLRWLQLKR